jgi:hypothetical protein
MISNAPKGLVLSAMNALGLRDSEAFEVQRLAICKQCSPKKKLCPECGCVKKAKVTIKEESCPLNLWQSV